MIPQAQTIEQTEAGWKPFGGYQGQTYAGFTPAQQQAMGLTSDIATGGGSSVGAANALNNYTLGGGFLSAGNPYFQNMENSVAQSVLPQLNSQWEAMGRFNSPNAQQDIGKGLTAAMMPYAYQNYTNERNNMMNAQGMAGSLDQAQYFDPSMLYGVGQTQQQMNQQGINQAIQAATWNQQQPVNAWQNQLANLESMGKMGSTNQSTQTQTTTQSPLQTGLGAAMMAGGVMTGNPMLLMGGASAFGMKSPFGGGGGGGGGGGNYYGGYPVGFG